MQVHAACKPQGGCPYISLRDFEKVTLYTNHGGPRMTFTSPLEIDTRHAQRALGFN